MKQAAASDATLLVCGESGSGKSAVARALHESSSRSAAPIVSVDLAALPPTLIEAELFGHVEGAFTGAVRARRGRFAQADGGTIVLEELAQLPIELQGRLLRVLQERTVEPVGSEEVLQLDVRVIATAQSDLRAAVERGELREDLYWRIAVVPLEVPPLRARIDDLPELCAHLMERLARGLGLAPRALGDGALARLASYPWPGNVRELENALERVLVLSAGTELGPVAAQEFDFLEERSQGVADELCERALAHGLTLADIEHALLERALAEERGNRSAAARRIGLTRRALDYRLARRDRST